MVSDNNNNVEKQRMNAICFLFTFLPHTQVSIMKHSTFTEVSGFCMYAHP